MIFRINDTESVCTEISPLVGEATFEVEDLDGVIFITGRV